MLSGAWWMDGNQQCYVEAEQQKADVLYHAIALLPVTLITALLYTSALILTAGIVVSWSGVEGRSMAIEEVCHQYLG